MKFWSFITKAVSFVLPMIAGMGVYANLAVEEEFNYGSFSNSLAGLNGGTGFAGSWSNDAGMGSINYTPVGLIFGNLATVAGAAQVGTVSNMAPYLKAENSRQLNLGANLTGALYGSYLFSIPYITTSGNDSLAILFGGTNITNAGLGGSPDNAAQMDVSALYYKGSGKGNVRLTGSAGSASGTIVAANTTYMVLWESDGLVTSGSRAQDLNLWMLTASQFGYFKTNGLSALSLNSAALGTASNNVLERAALAGTYGATFLTNSFVGLYATFYSSNNPIGMTIDEIRVGTGGLDEVTPVTAVSMSPQIIIPPASQTQFSGSPVKMSVDAVGYPALSYLWKCGAIGSGVYTNLGDDQNISGSTSAKLVIASVSPTNAGDYVAVVSNAVGAVTSSPPATLTISNPLPPQITTAPVSQAVHGGSPLVQFSVVATGPALTYQWFVRSLGGSFSPLSDAGNVSGSTSPTLTLNDVSTANAGAYQVMVSNSAGSVSNTSPATLTVDYTTNSAPDWGLGPFVRPDGVNPIISSNINFVFQDPILDESVNWEYTHTFNPAATLMGGQVCLLYRAEDNSGNGIGTYCSRDGLATSADGLRFTCGPTPSLYPNLDAQEASEWSGGCEDPRLVETTNGTYVVLYTQWNHSLARLGVAVSTNLINWTKYGSPFALYGNSSVNAATGTKSAGILTALVGGQLKAVKHLGQYWMYWGEGAVNLATSDDLINWRPLDSNLLTTRSGKFDSSLVEGGPPAVLTPKGIVVFYNGKNASPGDTNINAGAYSGGQALFDAKEPSKLVARVDHPFFQPEAPFEVTGQYAAGTTFIEGLVPFQNQWFLYYGAADTYVGVATCTQTNFGLSGPWPNNFYYQGFDGLNVGATNSLDGALLYSTAMGKVAGVQDSFQKELQLTANGTTNVTSAFVLPDIASGGAIYGFSARWDSEFFYTNLPASGLSFNLSHITNSQILDVPVESGYGDGLSVDIDNDKSGTPGFYLRVDNSIIATQAFNPDLQWGKTNSFRNYFAMDWNYSNGLSFLADGVEIFTNIPTPGFIPAPGRLFSWAARTGTNSGDVRIDNTCIIANGNLVPIPLSPAYQSSSSTPGNDVSNAFDGIYGTQWQTASPSGWIQASCAGGPQVVTAYSIVSAGTNWQQDPRTWTLLGSNDGTNWMTVDAEYLEGWENNDALMRRVPRTFIVNQPAAYQTYQLNIATNNGAALTQLADLTLYTSRSTIPQPVINRTTSGNNTLVVSGIAGPPAGQYYILAATNVALPASQWSVVATNQFDAAGNFVFTNTLVPNAQTRFFRLSLP